jgi:hypothetical protein
MKLRSLCGSATVMLANKDEKSKSQFTGISRDGRFQPISKSAYTTVGDEPGQILEDEDDESPAKKRRPEEEMETNPTMPRLPSRM